MEHGNDSDLRRKECISAIKKGSKDAFQELFRKYYENLCRFAYRFVKSKIIAEDLVQEVFVKIWERRDQLDPEKSIKSYLYKSVKNEALDYLKHENMVSKKLSLLKIALDTEMPKRDFKELNVEKFSTLVQLLIEKLPEKTRQIYKLNKKDGLSYKEISDLMDLSVKSVEYHISQALQFIRISMKENIDSFIK